jgi:hypothetical protein
MRSPAAAMTWELLARDRWGLPAALLSALGLPLLLFAMLQYDGEVLPDDKSAVILHLVLLETNVVIFGGALLARQWNLTQLYARPVTTATIVTWRLGPSMVLMALQTVTWTLLLNALFDLDWPVAGPAAYSAVTLAAAAAAVWLTGQSNWSVFGLTVVLAVSGTWLQSRFAALFSESGRTWDAVTVGEGATLLATAILAFWAATIAVARNRRGEPPFSLGLVAWLARLFDRPARREAPYCSTAHAQLWYAWRNSWVMPMAMPAVMLLILGIGLAGWLLSERSARDVLEGVLAGRGFLPIMALIAGAVMGEISSPKKMAMSQFLATRPIPSTAIARSALVGGAVSLVVLWVVWAIAVGGAMLVASAAEPAPATLLPGVSAWQEIPGAIVASWILLGVGATMLLSGRTALAIKVVLVAGAAWVAFAILSKVALTPPVQAMCERAIAIAVGVACALGTAWTLVVARRRGLIEGATATAGVVVWVGLEIAAALALPSQATMTGSILLCGALSLAILPLGAAPLAVAWNRAR